MHVGEIWALSFTEGSSHMCGHLSAAPGVLRTSTTSRVSNVWQEKLQPCKLSRFPSFALMTKSREVGVKDMSAHSLAPRGQQSPPPSEPEGLTD